MIGGILAEPRTQAENQFLGSFIHQEGGNIEKKKDKSYSEHKHTHIYIHTHARAQTHMYTPNKTLFKGTFQIDGQEHEGILLMKMGRQ